MEKMAWDGPKWAPRGLFPANPDLADILGDTDVYVENFIFWIFWIPNFQISKSQISKVQEIWPGPPGSRWSDA